jgi:hypothetical protein
MADYNPNNLNDVIKRLEIENAELRGEIKALKDVIETLRPKQWTNWPTPSITTPWPGTGGIYQSITGGTLSSVNQTPTSTSITGHHFSNSSVSLPQISHQSGYISRLFKKFSPDGTL